MDDLGIEISGLEDCIKQLTSLPPRIVKGAFGKALVAGAIPIVEALEARTPVDSGLTKGAIKSDIEVNADAKGGKVSIGFGKRGFIARMVEFGHRSIGHRPNKKDSGKTVQAHPFMRIAAASSAEAATKDFEETLITSLDNGEV